MLMNMKELLAVANAHHFAVPAFNIGTCQFLKAIVELCEEKDAPVILAIHPDEQEFQGDAVMSAVIRAAKDARVPVCVHLDHSGLKPILRAVRNGFTSVMIDASALPFEENIAATKQVVDLLHPLNISVEGELGTIGKTDGAAEDGADDIIYTRPEEAAAFVERTGVDALAIAIGTAHGIYPKNFVPHLKLDLLSEIKKTVSVPLVLHGGSNNPDGEIAESVKRGINKINISSDIKVAFYERLRITLANDPKVREPFELYLDAIEAMKQCALHKMELFDTVGKAKLYHV